MKRILEWISGSQAGGRRGRGQALIVIAGAMVALLAVVSLAVDGANAYVQRRDAQNATDGATMAGITTMATFFQQNAYYDSTAQKMKIHPLSAAQNTALLQVISSTLAANNASTSWYNSTTNPNGPFEAYFLDSTGQRYGGYVGDGTSVSFAGGDGVSGSAGAQGLWVKTLVKSNTYFARIIGWDTVQSDAHAGALLGSVSALQDMGSRGNNNGKLWPLTIFTNTINYNGGTSLYDFNTGYSPGNWGLVCFTGNCGQSEVDGWLASGYDPSTGLDGNLEDSAHPGQTGTSVHYTSFPVGWDGTNSGSSGIWIGTKPGNGISSACSTLTTAAAEHWHVGIPITDYDDGGHGRNLNYHIVNIAVFEITAASCPGHNSITGRFLSFNWGMSSATWNSDLSKAVKTGQTVIRLGP